MTDPQSAIRTPQSPDGVLVIDKPPDWTSHDVVARARKILRTRRVGHTGTLDPFATGVLVVCVNQATRLVQFLAGSDKEYVATMRLGWATDTGDLTGALLRAAVDARHVTAEQVRVALGHFRGRSKQVPPMYSAKKVAGKKLYELARQGKTVERQPVEIEIKDIELLTAPATLLAGGGETLTQDFSFRVVCSAGTYVRTLAEDVGKRLGLGAHLVALRRTRAGECDLSRALTLEQLAELTEAGHIASLMIPPAAAVALAEVRLNEDECKAVAHGHSIRRHGDWLTGTRAKLCDGEQRLIAIAEFAADQQAWRPRVVLTVA